MPHCHKCPHDRNPTDACIECARREERREAFGSDLLHDERTVSLDALAESGVDPAAWRPSPEALADADEREGQADGAGFPFPQMLDFLQRLFTLTPQEFAAVRAVAVRNRSAEHARPDFLREIAAEIGVPSKQAVKAVVARAVSRCPELRALVSLTLSFTSADAARLRAALADGATFPGRLALTAGGVLSSPIGPKTAENSGRSPAGIPPRPANADCGPGNGPRSARNPETGNPC